MLLGAGQSPDGEEEGDGQGLTPLMCAATNGNLQVMEAQLEAGGPSAESYSGRTAHALAAKFSRNDCAEALQRALNFEQAAFEQAGSEH